ncbi:hypothetical protein Leryth_026932 [Lithospermum erythrorhizon]|nr:hypothetical protein Leryth_026932 [Lithospermum erythrorhizon]
MGRATRWLKGLFGMNKKKENLSEKRATTLNNSCGLSQNLKIMPPDMTPAEAAWLRSFYEDDNESDSEQRKQAIAVAAATAAAADAAVAAAQAAAAVVRLSSQGRGAMLNGCKENMAAVKIQTVFRSFLARKALKALRGVVKLQAIVRGFLARKQTHATVVIMKALSRAQMDAHAQKCRGLIPNHEECPPQSQPRKSLENCDDVRVEHRVIPRHSRRLSASFEISNVMKDVDEWPKIVEVDTVRPKSRNRTKSSVSEQCDDLLHNHTKSCPLLCRNAPRLPTPDRWNFNQSFESDEHMLAAGNECGLSTAQTTPCFGNSCVSNAPLTPTKSVCVDGYLGNINKNLVPSYMASTQSFKAKLRSQSAPKQRQEPPSRRRLSLEKMESRSTLSGLRRQRSCSHAQEVINFKNVVGGKLGRSSDFVNEQVKDYYS